MRLTTIRSFGLRTLAALLFACATSKAALVPDPVTSGANHELFVGFRASGGQGGSTSYLVKLGAASSFLTVEGTSFDLNLGTLVPGLGADLAATYGGVGDPGGAWYTRSDLFWGIFGTSTSANPLVYGSRERVSIGTLSDPWPNLDLTARNSVNTQIGTNVLTGIGGYRGSTATANSPVATLQANTGNSTSYNFQVATAGTTDFGSLSQWTSIEGDFGGGTAGTVLDVWRAGSTGVTYRGAFSINEAGVIHYQFLTVPEPSVSLLLAVVGAATCGLRRRRAAGQS
jgi:hypothetical protein